MKKIAKYLPLITILCISSLNCLCQSSCFEFLDSNSWEFDNAKLGHEANLTCRAINISEDTLRLNFRKTGGPFSPKFPTGPILPGDTISVDYYFKFKQIGAFRKKIKIRVNQKNSDEVSFLVLKLRGVIYK